MLLFFGKLRVDSSGRTLSVKNLGKGKEDSNRVDRIGKEGAGIVLSFRRPATKSDKVILSLKLPWCTDMSTPQFVQIDLSHIGEWTGGAFLARREVSEPRYEAPASGGHPPEVSSC